MDEKQKRHETFRRKVSLRKRILRWWETWCLLIVALAILLCGVGFGWVIHKPKTVTIEVPVQLPAPYPTIVIRYATEEEKAEREREMVEAVAKTVWGEARGCSVTEQAAVVWCILNRVDDSEFPNDPLFVVQQKSQFDGYDLNNPVEPELVALVKDVLDRRELEDTAVGSVGRVLPADYLYFDGDGSHNHFRQEYERSGEIWDWSLPSPYEKDTAPGAATPEGGRTK